MTAATKNDAPATTAAGVVALLRARYPTDSTILLEEVRDAAGFSASRSCDVITLGTWPSRGLTLRGFEVKVSRADWKRELDQPHKAEAFAPFCDEWYIAAGSSKIVQLDELPETWGLLVAKGKRLDLVRPATKNPKPEPVDRGFLVALLKRTKEQGPSKDALARAAEEGFERGKKHTPPPVVGSGPDYAYALKERDELAKKIADFERAAGLVMSDFRYAGDTRKLGAALRAVLYGSTNPMKQNAKYMIEQLERVVKQLIEVRDIPDLTLESSNDETR